MARRNPRSSQKEITRHEQPPLARIDVPGGDTRPSLSAEGGVGTGARPPREGGDRGSGAQALAEYCGAGFGIITGARVDQRPERELISR